MGLVRTPLLAARVEAQFFQLALFRKGTRRKTRPVRLLDRILPLEIDEEIRATRERPRPLMGQKAARVKERKQVGAVKSSLSQLLFLFQATQKVKSH